MAKSTQTDEEKAADEQIGKAPERPEGVPEGSVFNAETGFWEGDVPPQTPPVDALLGEANTGNQPDFAEQFAKAVATLQPQSLRMPGTYTPVPVIAPESIKTTTAKNGTVTAHINGEE